MRSSSPAACGRRSGSNSTGSAPPCADFWWRPHLLVYGSLAVNAVLALAALFYATRGAGGLRQRFRTDPLIGVVGLVSAYMALTAWADLLWHRIYGLDITAWSLPHILMGLNMLLLMLAAAAVQVSVLPRPAEWTTRRLGLGEINVVVQLAIATTVLLLVGVTEYDTLPGIAARSPEAGPFLQAFQARPAWLYPVIVLAVGLFAGNVALQLLRRPGAATLVMLAVLCYRALLLAVFQSRNPDFSSTASSQFLILLPAAGLDLIYFFRQQTADERETWLLANLTGITLMLTLGLVLLPRLLAYLPVTERTIPWMVVMGVLVGLWAGWCGEAVGAALDRIHRLPPLAQAERLRVAALAGGICAGLVAFAVFFVVTATPPA